MESAVVLAGHYCKACKRSVITPKDMSYGLMYAARNVTGKHTGSLYPEAYDDEEESESQCDSSDSDEDEDEEPWSRYEGTEDDMARQMNECADTWAQWAPTNPTERALKNAVDKNSFFGREE